MADSPSPQGRSVAAICRELGDRIANLTNEVVASFVSDSRDERVQKMRVITGQIEIDNLFPVAFWLERRRPPDKVDLLRRRVHLICNDAVDCVAADIPEYAGGRVSEVDPATVSPGCRRTLTLSISQMIVAQFVQEWADEIEAEETREASPSGKADTKTDKEKKLPDNEQIVRCAKFIREKRKRMDSGDTPKAERIDIVREFLDDHHPEPKPKLKAFDKNFQPSRYGWLLELGSTAD